MAQHNTHQLKEKKSAGVSEEKFNVHSQQHRDRKGRDRVELNKKKNLIYIIRRSEGATEEFLIDFIAVRCDNVTVRGSGANGRVEVR